MHKAGLSIFTCIQPNSQFGCRSDWFLLFYCRLHWFWLFWVWVSFRFDSCKLIWISKECPKYFVRFIIKPIYDKTFIMSFLPHLYLANIFSFPVMYIFWMLISLNNGNCSINKHIIFIHEHKLSQLWHLFLCILKWNVDSFYIS